MNFAYEEDQVIVNVATGEKGVIVHRHKERDGNRYDIRWGAYSRVYMGYRENQIRADKDKKMAKFNVNDRVKGNRSGLIGTVVSVEPMDEKWPGKGGKIIDSYTIKWDTVDVLRPRFRDHELTFIETAKVTDLQRVIDKEKELIAKRKLLENQLIEVKREIDNVRTAKTVLLNL